MKVITKKDIEDLRKQFDKYTARAEQYEFPMLMLVDLKFKGTEKAIKSGKYNIEENQKDLRAMFRVVLGTMHKDFKEYEEEKWL